MSYIVVDERKIGTVGRSLSVTIPALFKDLERIDKSDTWLFVYPLYGQVMLFTKENSLEELKKILERFIELVDFKLEKGVKRLKKGYW